MTNTTTSLFSRYKNMINDKWAAGERTYTASELNLFVGDYENTTHWKRATNNPYYTTRNYQTELKELGCITMIKRGLWQINAPIPEWFGSFHFRGLKGGFDPNNRYADHGCIYWKALPAHHKVNPWKNIDPMRVMASIGNDAPAAQVQDKPAQTEAIYCDFVMYTVSGIPVTSKIPGLTVNCSVNVYSDNHAPGAAAEIVDWIFYMDGEMTGMNLQLLEVLDVKMTDAEDVAKKRAIDAYTAAQKKQPTEKMYTEAQVKQILSRYTEDLQMYIDRGFNMNIDLEDYKSVY